VHDAGTRPHELHFTRGDDRLVPHRITVLDCAAYDVRHDFHVIVWMHGKSAAAFDDVVIEHSQFGESNPLWIVVFGKTESVVCQKPRGR